MSKKIKLPAGYTQFTGTRIVTVPRFRDNVQYRVLGENQFTKEYFLQNVRTGECETIFIAHCTVSVQGTISLMKERREQAQMIGLRK